MSSLNDIIRTGFKPKGENEDGANAPSEQR